MTMEISKTYSFDSAHLLPKVPCEHKCRRLHGHTYRVTVFVKGEVNPEYGWVEDFGNISKIMKPLIDDELDHRYLNDIPGLENPTAENICIWIWNKVKPKLPKLSKVRIEETCTSACEYSG